MRIRAANAIPTRTPAIKQTDAIINAVSEIIKLKNLILHLHIYRPHS